MYDFHALPHCFLLSKKSSFSGITSSQPTWSQKPAVPQEKTSSWPQDLLIFL